MILWVVELHEPCLGYTIRADTFSRNTNRDVGGVERTTLQDGPSPIIITCN